MRVGRRCFSFMHQRHPRRRLEAFDLSDAGIAEALVCLALTAGAATLVRTSARGSWNQPLVPGLRNSFQNEPSLLGAGDLSFDPNCFRIQIALRAIELERGESGCDV